MNEFCTFMMPTNSRINSTLKAGTFARISTQATVGVWVNTHPYITVIGYKINCSSSSVKINQKILFHKLSTFNVASFVTLKKKNKETGGDRAGQRTASNKLRRFLLQMD